ncbi:glycosyltransferase family 4 protein [Mammaliicoccus sciuri]|uniref:glycosyltransferase family 4 protein n=1 Tax=Mammaliicoccus sciuri TaxID=1296 RepID=UPI003F57B7A4
MRITFIHDHKFIYFNNNYYSTGKLSKSVLSNYLVDPVKKIQVISRGIKNEYDINSLTISSSNQIQINPIWFLQRKSDFFTKKNKIIEFLNESISDDDIIIIRLPSEIGLIAAKELIKKRIPFGIELVGDPWSSLWYHSSIIGKLRANINKYKTKKIISKSSNCIYVTKSHLQKKYPTNGKSFSASNVLIKEVNTNYEVKETNFPKIGLIASLDTKYKGIDTALKSLSLLDYDFTFEIVGNGPQEKWLKKIRKYNLENKVVLLGAIKGGVEMNNWLKNLDLYIQPSYTEGLPRALIEAMSNGVPCLGSNAGGIPELLNKKFIHKTKDYQTFSKQINEVLNNTNLRIEMSKTNLKVSENYLSQNIQRQREAFIKSIYREI